MTTTIKKKKTAVEEKEEDDRKFMELMETKDITCIICDVLVGDKYQVIDHFKIRHPHIYETISK
jgi:hypothetical protein